ncbi:hypothetical protein ACH5RR_004568 [Cinchona calisaya]|uniref:Uncharacterized protein n=1 Tax=Cinchona calisaya TaxID=153742 RepID=A0ABD3AXX3_9GENT
MYRQDIYTASIDRTKLQGSRRILQKAFVPVKQFKLSEVSNICPSVGSPKTVVLQEYISPIRKNWKEASGNKNLKSGWPSMLLKQIKLPLGSPKFQHFQTFAPQYFDLPGLLIDDDVLLVKNGRKIGVAVEMRIPAIIHRREREEAGATESG